MEMGKTEEFQENIIEHFPTYLTENVSNTHNHVCLASKRAQRYNSKGENHKILHFFLSSIISSIFI